MKRFKYSMETLSELNDILSKCSECGKCMEHCLMLKKWCSSPKDLMKSLTEQETVDISLPYSCNMCGYCKGVCPQGIELDESFLLLKNRLTKINKNVPPIKGYKSIKFHQKYSFSKMFTSCGSVNDVENIKRVFLPGCSLSSYNPELVIKTYEYINKKLKGTAIVLKCCGNPTHVIGQEDLFRSYYNEFIKEIERTGAVEIITACPSCYETIKRNSPNFKIKYLWELIDEIGLPEGVGVGVNVKSNCDVVFSLHDPCPTREENKVHNSVRKIIDELGYSIEEFPLSREKTLCCGAGGMVSVTNSNMFHELVTTRVNQATSAYILTYCASCVYSLQEGNKHCIHLLDLIFNKDILSTLTLPIKKTNSLTKWINRYKCKKMIDTYTQP